MKRILVICSLLASATLVLSAEAITQQQVEYWGSLVAGKDFRNIIRVFEVGPDHEWPKVVSADYKSSLEDEQEVAHEKFRDYAKSLLNRIEVFEGQLNDMPPDEFDKSVRALLEMRNDFASQPSYVNALMADAINRVVLVNLSCKLSAEAALQPTLSSLAKRLANFDISIRTMLGIVEEELDQTVIENGSELNDDAEMYRQLWFALEGEVSILFPHNAGQAGTYELLQSQGLALLLWRYAMTDLQIQIALPLAFEYRQRADDFSIKDGYQEIKAALGEELNRKRTFSSHVFGLKMGASVAAELLDDVEAGRIRRQLFFVSDAGGNGVTSPDSRIEEGK